MNITVTGGAGFIGHHLVARLIRSGHSVTVLDNLHRGSFERPELSRAVVIHGDIRNPLDCGQALENADAVVHLAAQAAVMTSQTDPDYTIQTNVHGTWNVAEASRDASVPHLIFASSREVYGDRNTLPVHESAPVAPRNLYGATKAAGEALLATLRGSDTSTTVLRFSNVIGHGDTDRVVPRWLAAASNGGTLTVYGGKQVIDFLPVETAVDAIVSALENGAVGAPVNIGSGVGTTLTDLAERVLAIFPDSGATVEVQPARQVEVSRFVADTGRMVRVLGVLPPDDPLKHLQDYGA